MRATHSSTAKTILVVEDERIVAKDLQQMLSGFGYNVPATAASSEDAMRLAAEKCPDLVLMDIRIKGQRDGIETAGILRERFGVPIVYLTAHADDDAVARAKKTEPYGYLIKPSELTSSGAPSKSPSTSMRWNGHCPSLSANRASAD